MAMPMSEVTENLVLAGEGKTKRPQSQMVVLGIMAGALIAAGAMASSVAMHAISNAGLARLTAGLVFSHRLCSDGPVWRRTLYG